MTAPWMDHPKLVAWFDELEDAVTTSFALTDGQRHALTMRKAPRENTWIMFAKDTNTRAQLRDRLRLARHHGSVVVIARDCHVLELQTSFSLEDDTFETDNGFSTVEIDYVEDLRRELISDAEDYAASDDGGWFYAITDGDYVYDSDGDMQP